jgi:hypothetical protein
MSEHIQVAVTRAVEGYWSANEDEDVLTGHLGACLKIGSQKVQITQKESQNTGEWSWSIDYYKFRGRGKNATEHILGADGLFELRLQSGERTELKSLLFQAKKDWSTSPELIDQCIKLSTWREAAFVLNYSPSAFEAFLLDDVLRLRGLKPPDSNTHALGEFLAKDFLECLIGDTELSYDPKARRLIWRSLSGEIVSTIFKVKHRIRANVKAPPFPGYGRLGRQISNSEIYDYRMEASDEDILSLGSEYSKKELKTARNNLALAYHTDHYNDADELIQQILTRRMQEVNQAYERVYSRREQKK